MYNPKHSTPRRPGRPLSSRKALFALVSVLFLVFAAVGVTVAYLQTQTEPLENQFTPAKVSCKVEETFDGNVKSNVTIRNTGDTDAFIRVAIVANWVQTDDNDNSKVTSVHAQKPVLDVDYTLTLDDVNEKWLKDSNGFYYYKNAVEPDGSTAVLIKECKPIESNAPAGYTLAVEIVASAIQASPETVAEEYWRISVEKGEIIGVQPSREVGNE